MIFNPLQTQILTVAGAGFAAIVVIRGLPALLQGKTSGSTSDTTNVQKEESKWLKLLF